MSDGPIPADHSTADALVRAIRATPDDDAPWLVYSDWLEENGRGEAARVLRLVLPSAQDALREGTSLEYVMESVSRLAGRGYSGGLVVFGRERPPRYFTVRSVDDGPTIWERVAGWVGRLADRPMPPPPPPGREAVR